MQRPAGGHGALPPSFSVLGLHYSQGSVYCQGVQGAMCRRFFFPVLGHLSICNLTISFFALMYKNLCISMSLVVFVQDLVDAGV